MKLQIFNQINFLPALKALFKDLKVPMNYVADEPTTAKEILKDTYKENDSFHLMDDVYFVGMVDDAAFEGNKSLDAEKIKSDYDGILIFGVTLKERPNRLLPTRSQLAEISRAFNREFYYTPVVVVFKYGNHLAFANTERLKYKQEWREGEKAGKVSLLRDINIEKPHSGHERILFGDGKEKGLQIDRKKINSFNDLYRYWQEVFSVSLLNKKFYQELSNWYFWATQHVAFPGQPTIADAHHKNANLDDLLQEHRATNVIRMLTRLLFVWFIKEKKLIPAELFELETLQKDILNEISPYHEKGMFKERNKESVYYKAILQNLFFATLNCPIEGDSLDKRKRGFRGDGYGTHRGIDYLMRYKPHFKNPDAFLEKLNAVVPFLNGGLFECLDDKFNNTYIDGFSDQMTKGEQLIVPDYLFFGVEEETDLSDIVGISDKKYKQAAVKGLINILKSYKFTITENTPIEEDVALDPELLGKVFENLLASYNPETKTTARKQTGSFYTPREIVNYMVDESLIAYLKNAISDWVGLDDETLDKELHVLTSFDSKVPLADKPDLQKQIITALSTCTILDPACGSGAFPMGILQKMVHILQKFDPDNKVWKEVQLGKAETDSKAAFEIEDKQAREERLIEINEAFDQSINDPDYARKLFLIENCIYGVDIQPIATQISKLRFFISLVVEQKVNPDKDNFGIRPLPNLETKFVAANTLMGIKKDGGLFETDEVKQLENELKIVRHKIFSLKSKERKIAWREKDKELREKLSSVLKNQGLPLDAAEKLAKWDPYDQNASSPFFDSEWMFGIQNGFDVVIGNPPYLGNKEIGAENQKVFKNEFGFTDDMYHYFFKKGIDFLKLNGIITYITPNTFLTLISKQRLRKLFLSNQLREIFLVGYVFDSAYVDTAITTIVKGSKHQYLFKFKEAKDSFEKPTLNEDYIEIYINSPDNIFYPPTKTNQIINSKINSQLIDVYQHFKKVTSSQSSLKSNISAIKKYRNDLNVNDISLLGLIAEGAQGLVTGNNSKYLSIICSTTEVEEQIKSLLIEKIIQISGNNLQKHLSTRELYELAESIKHKNSNPSIFGKFFLYKTVHQQNVLSLSDLSENEQLNGSDKDECWIYYSRGNSEGFRWMVPYVEAINWTRNNVKELKEGVKTNSRWQGGEFYNKTGFGWVDYFTNQIKAFFVPQGPYSKNVVKFHSVVDLSDKYLTGLLNSKFTTYYVQNFITNTHTLQINDGKLIPVKYPNKEFHYLVELLVNITLLFQKRWAEEILDALFFNLYFPDHMKERGIDVLEFVEWDIHELMQGREFEKLSDAEKERVIEQLHAKWSHPDNEVRNRIKLFAVRSPEILKPILES